MLLICRTVYSPYCGFHTETTFPLRVSARIEKLGTLAANGLSLVPSDFARSAFYTLQVCAAGILRTLRMCRPFSLTELSSKLTSVQSHENRSSLEAVTSPPISQTAQDRGRTTQRPAARPPRSQPRA